MHNTYEHIAGLGIALLDIALKAFRKRFVAGLVALHDFPGNLIDYNYMIVFVEYFHLSAYFRQRYENFPTKEVRHQSPQDKQSAASDIKTDTAL